VAARSTAWVFGRSLVGRARSNSAGSMDVLSLLSVARCQVEVCATDRSFVQVDPTECGVSEVMVKTQQ
jgi:hypothetical protein